MSQLSNYFRSLAGVKVHYDRDPGAYGTDGKPYDFYATRELQSKLEAFFTELWQACPLGKAQLITSAGAYVDKPNSQHNSGNAMDIDCIFWENKKFITKKYPNDKLFYLGVEAILRKHFGNVLNYHYNVAHQDHFHVDVGKPVGFRTSRANTLFLQAALSEVYYDRVAIDGNFGDETKAALARVLNKLNIQGGLNDLNKWLTFLDATAKTAFVA